MKDYWYINGIGDVIRAVYKSDDLTRSLIAIGNYFETPEEAEKAVKKLEAFKRLKDKKIFIYLDHFDYRSQDGSFNVEFGNNLSSDELNQVNEDLDLIFGVEE